MKKTAIVLAFVCMCMFIIAGCAQDGGEYMPEVKDRTNIFEVYDCKSQKLVKEFGAGSGDEALLILDGIMNNPDSSKNYTEELGETQPEYILVYCGQSDEMSVYVKIRFSEGKVYREIYSSNENSMALDQGILECITVTEEEFRNILA